MKKRKIVLMIFGSIILSGCSENPLLPTESQIVVQAFLYDNETVSDVYVGRSSSLGSADSTNQPISTAAVTLQKNGTTYRLTPDVSREGYYFYSGADLVVATGDQYSIQIVGDGTTVMAKTTVPTKPVAVSISKPVITFTTETISTPMGTRTRVSLSDTVNIQWINSTNDLYFVVVKSIDSNRTAISTDTMGMVRSRMFTSRPTTENYYRLSESQLQYTGKYYAYVYHVNEEYANLYKSREQDSRNMTEPLTNIKNGLGIFSAFASDTVSFIVKKE
jgi:hypothetical protein